MEKRLEVHIIKSGKTYTVWQEGTMLVPKLTRQQALTAATRLGGKILIYDEEGVTQLPHEDAVGRT